MAIGISTSYVFRQFLNGVGGSTYLQFNGTDQYAEHAAWTPTGVNFSISLRYTPASADIGSLVTILGDGILQKDASNNLVFNYTDTGATSQAVTLSTLALVADTEYLIVVASDGNGVSVTVGADTASNAAVIDPSTLEIESWMASAGATLSAGIVRELVYQDELPSPGDYLVGDGTNMYVSTAPIILPASVDFSITGQFFFANSADTFSEWFSSSYQPGGVMFDVTGDQVRFFGFSQSGSLAFIISSSANDWQKQTWVSFACTRAGTTYELQLNGVIVGSTTGSNSEDFSIDNLHRRGSVYSRVGDAIANFVVSINQGDTYEYLLNNITDNGDGTGLAPNTGNTGSSFDGTVQNYDASTDLVTIPNNTRNYPVATDGNIQPDTLNPGAGNDATIVNFDQSMVQ